MIYEDFKNPELVKVDIEAELIACAKYVSVIWKQDFNSVLSFFRSAAKMAKEMTDGFYHRDYNPSLAFLDESLVHFGLLMSSGNMSLHQKHIDHCPAFNECYESKLSMFAKEFPWLVGAEPKQEPIGSFEGSKFNTCRQIHFGTAVTVEFMEEECNPPAQLVRAALAHFTQAELINTAIDIMREVKKFIAIGNIDEEAVTNEFPWIKRILEAD